MEQPRKMIDCRAFPNEVGCTLAISGREDEVLTAAVAHAVSVHGHRETPRLREDLRAILVDEPAAAAF